MSPIGRKVPVLELVLHHRLAISSAAPPILTPLDEHPLLEATIIPSFARLATASFLGFRYRRLCRELRALALPSSYRQD